MPCSSIMRLSCRILVATSLVLSGAGQHKAEGKIDTENEIRHLVRSDSACIRLRRSYRSSRTNFCFCIDFGSETSGALPLSVGLGVSEGEGFACVRTARDRMSTAPRRLRNHSHI